MFEIKGTYNPATQLVSSPPAELAAAEAAAEPPGLTPKQQQQQQQYDGLALATMDIFAGCGGLSNGLHQAGVSVSKWAIEFDGAAAEAFKLNNTGAAVLSTDCNAILVVSMACSPCCGLELSASCCTVEQADTTTHHY